MTTLDRYKMDDYVTCVHCRTARKVRTLGQKEGGEGFCPECDGVLFYFEGGDPQRIRSQCIVELSDKRYAGKASFSIILDKGMVTLNVNGKVNAASYHPELYEKLYDYCEGRIIGK